MRNSEEKSFSWDTRQNTYKTPNKGSFLILKTAWSTTISKAFRHIESAILHEKTR